jgi:hypothetical protein
MVQSEHNRRSSSDSLLIRSDILRLVHWSLLQMFPPLTVWQFWKSNLCIPEANPDAVAAFFESILNSGTNISMAYVLSVLTALEPFLVKQGNTLDDFAQKLFSRELHTGNLVPYTRLIRIYSLFAKNIMKIKDFRHAYLQVMQWSIRIASRHFHCKIVRHSVSGGWHRNLLLFSIKNGEDTIRLPFDFDVWIGKRLKSMPVTIGLPAYEHVKSVSDMRAIEVIAPESVINRTKGTIRIGNAVGLECSFGEFCEKQGITLKKYGIRTDVAVVEMLDDYFCPCRKRVVLHKGCAYGAPAHLFQTEFAECCDNEPRRIISFVMKMVAKEQRVRRRMKILHEEFIKYCNPGYSFVYDVRLGEMFVNGRYMTRGIPAKILRKIVSEHVQTGKTEFERRRLLDDNDIVQNKSNPCLERRIDLLHEALARKCELIDFNKTEKGMIRFNPFTSILFLER